MATSALKLARAEGVELAAKELARSWGFDVDDEAAQIGARVVERPSSDLDMEDFEQGEAGVADENPAELDGMDVTADDSDSLRVAMYRAALDDLAELAATLRTETVALSRPPTRPV